MDNDTNNKERCVGTIKEYLDEVSKINQQWSNPVIAFRGQENDTWELNSSAERRIEKCTKQDFIDYHEDLLKRCKLKNYDKRDGKQLYELELLADLQHNKAASGLIDFTRTALIALWFACEEDKKNDGQVFVINTAEDTFLEITRRDIQGDEIQGNSISKILNFDTRSSNKGEDNKGGTAATSSKSPNFWYWTPAHLNERITAQHSLFIFGLPPLKDLNEKKIKIKQANKKAIREQLKQLHDIHEESLFPDFIGFAYTWRHNISYDTLDATGYMRRGIKSSQQGKYDEAIKDYDKTIKLDPKNTYAYNNRGNAYLGQRKYGEAIENYGKAIELNPKNAAAYYNRGNAYLDQRKYDKAIENYGKAIELNPKNAAAYYNRGNAYLGQRKYGEAIENYGKAIGLDPKNAAAYYNRGNAYFAQEKYDEVIGSYDKAIELGLEHTNAYYNRGIAYFAQEKYDEAIENYDKAIELDPEHTKAYYNRSIAWLALQEWEKAKRDLTTAKDMGIDIAHVFRNIFESVAAFEKKFQVRLPEDIATMLTPPPK